MNIEISDRKYWKKLNYYDGLLYCQLLEIDGKDDWRMIQSEEEADRHIIYLPETGLAWYIDDFADMDVDDGGRNYLRIKQWWVVPVRDI